jgi:hypothetical protein
MKTLSLLAILSLMACYRDAVPDCSDIGHKRHEAIIYEFSPAGQMVRQSHYVNGVKCR